jgi:hypothetical protein
MRTTTKYSMIYQDTNVIEDDDILRGSDLTSWVLTKVHQWEEHYEGNYLPKHKEYDRIMRGIWAQEDVIRKSERSKLISPASAQAVESAVAEVEEAVFGRGDPIDIRDDLTDAEPQDIAQMRQELLEDFRKRKFRRACGEVLLTAATIGTGIMELVLDQVTEVVPATQPIDANTQAVGVEEKERVCLEYRPVHPRNFRIDPAATSVEGALGVAIDEFVPCHQVEQLQDAGIYRKDAVVGVAAWDTNLEPDQMATQAPQEQCRLIKYYGLVPATLLRADEDEGDDPLAEYDIERPEREDELYIEAIVVIDATSGELLKAEENPFMMRKRPVVAFQWDLVPGSFWGRGIVEKGYNSQKAVDAELRARADALALTAHPMLAVDGTRMPRGMNAKVTPGKTLVTTGNPNEILRPFNFGEVNQITFAQAEALERMHQRATGTLDSGGMQNQAADARSGAMSMALSGVMKRNKRTLVNFQEDFLIPLVEKAAWMYIQYDPERFPARDYKFTVSATLGIMAREYETNLLSNLLNTTGKDDPAYLPLMSSIVDNMQLANREQLKQQIIEAAQPDPAQQEAAQRQAQLQEQLLQAQIAAFQAQANESNKRAEKYEFEKRAIPLELENKRIEAVAKQLANGSADDKEFERRWKMAELLLRERDMDLKTFDSVTNLEGQTQSGPQGANDGTSSETGRPAGSSGSDQR